MPSTSASEVLDERHRHGPREDRIAVEERRAGVGDGRRRAVRRQVASGPRCEGDEGVDVRLERSEDQHVEVGASTREVGHCVR